jgi:hypothetical protein
MTQCLTFNINDPEGTAHLNQETSFDIYLMNNCSFVIISWEEDKEWHSMNILKENLLKFIENSSDENRIACGYKYKEVPFL